MTPINTGNARRKPAPRSAATFVPYPTWLDSGWATETAALGTKPRPRSHPPAELTVAAAIQVALRFVVAVAELGPDESFTPANDPGS